LKSYKTVVQVEEDLQPGLQQALIPQLVTGVP